MAVRSRTFTLALVAFIAQAHAASMGFDVPAQPLADSLRAVASQTNINLLFDPPLVVGRQAPSLKSADNAAEALTALLMGTGITFEFLNNRTVVLAAATTPSDAWQRHTSMDTRSGGEPHDGQTNSATPHSGDESREAGEVGGASDDVSNSLWQRFRISQAEGAPSATSSGDERITLEEIVVTAQKRLENIHDVPVPVTVLNADSLLSGNQLRLQDYYERVPGLTMTTGGNWASTSISLRGLSTGQSTNPTVGIMVDDVPFTASTVFGGGNSVPDFDPGDLARVEVLRGPQGTLYGGNNLGGLIKYVTVDPSTERFSGRLQTGFSDVYNAHQTGYNVRGSVNVPISDTWAVRASAFTRLDPGYVDNVFQGVEGINEGKAHGVHLAALWRPSDALSLKLSAYYQKFTHAGADMVEPALGGRFRQNFTPGTSWFDRRVQAYSATVTAKLGPGELTSVSGYDVNRNDDAIDTSSFFGFLTVPDFGVDGSVVYDRIRTRKFSQEVRYAMPLSSKLDWLVGAFYTHEDPEYLQPYHALDRSTGQVVGTGAVYNYSAKYTEYAAFTNFTYHFTDRFDVQLGGRQSYMRQPYSETRVGIWVDDLFPGLTSPYVRPKNTARDNASTYLLTPRFKVTPDMMVYARLASGYRVSGSNQAFGFPGVPPDFEPDKTQNYELGLKASFLDQRLSVDTSVYHIDWKDIQLLLVTPFGDFYWINGKQAKSDGVELSIEARPLRGLTIVASGAWTNAKLTDDIPQAAGGPAVGPKGARLPGTSLASTSVSIDQDFPLTAALAGFVGATASTIGDRPAYFKAPGATLYKGYTKIDVRGGLRYGDWTVDLFVNNLTNRYAVLNGDFIGPDFLQTYIYLQPRTYGLNLVRKW